MCIMTGVRDWNVPPGENYRGIHRKEGARFHSEISKTIKFICSKSFLICLQRHGMLCSWSSDT